MEESTCNEMVIQISQGFSSMLCLLFFFLDVLGFKYDFTLKLNE